MECSDVCEFEYEFRIGSLRYASYYSGDGKEVRLSECPSSYLIAGREVKERMTVRYEVDDPDSSHAKTGWSLPTGPYHLPLPCSVSACC